MSYSSRGKGKSDACNATPGGAVELTQKRICSKFAELSQWVDHVSKQLIEDLPEYENELTTNFLAQETPTRAAVHEDDCGAVAAIIGELRPGKVARKGPRSIFLHHQPQQWSISDDHHLGDDDQTNFSTESAKRILMSSSKRSSDEQGLNLLTPPLEFPQIATGAALPKWPPLLV